ncbi:MAG: ABC transporter substrate-binding protein [Ferruginibacter sp.]|nr:ABC transporter substrate-binding protein [Ferruginibacter sp.]
MNKRHITIGVTLITILFILFYFFKPQKEKSKDEISVQLSWFPGPENAFLFYGIEKGIFDSLNIKVLYKPSKGSSIVATSLANNQMNFGFISSDYVIVSKNKGLPLIAVMTLYHETPVTIFSLLEKNITKIEDLKDKKIGVIIKSAVYPQVKAFLKLNGLREGDYQEIPVVGTPNEILNNKNIDAMMHYSNYGPAEIKGKYKKEINLISLKNHGVDMYGTSLAVNESFAKDNPEVTTKFILGCLLSLQRAKTDHTGALNALLKHSPNSSKEEFDLALTITENMIYDSLSNKLGIGYMNTEGWQKTLSQVEKLNNEKYNIPIEQLFTTKFLQK